MTELSAPSAPAETNQWLPTRPAVHNLIDGSRADVPRQLCQSGSLPPVPVEVGRSRCTKTRWLTRVVAPERRCCQRRFWFGNPKAIYIVDYTHSADPPGCARRASGGA